MTVAQKNKSGFNFFTLKILIIFSLLLSFEIQAFSYQPTEQDKTLMAEAHNQIGKAFIPGGRSAYKVGVVFVLEDGTVITGANIKMANGLTLCAERTALAKALIDHGLNEKNLIQKVYISNNQPESSAPCGICRQSISFFAKPETLFFFEDEENQVIVQSMKELLPKPYIWRYAPSRKFLSKAEK